MAWLMNVLPSDFPIALELWDQVRTPGMGFGKWARKGLAALRGIDGA